MKKKIEFRKMGGGGGGGGGGGWGVGGGSLGCQILGESGKISSCSTSTLEK